MLAKHAFTVHVCHFYWFFRFIYSNTPNDEGDFKIWTSGLNFLRF